MSTIILHRVSKSKLCLHIVNHKSTYKIKTRVGQDTRIYQRDYEIGGGRNDLVNNTRVLTRSSVDLSTLGVFLSRRLRLRYTTRALVEKEYQTNHISNLVYLLIRTIDLHNLEYLSSKIVSEYHRPTFQHYSDIRTAFMVKNAIAQIRFVSTLPR